MSLIVKILRYALISSFIILIAACAQPEKDIKDKACISPVYGGFSYPVSGYDKNWKIPGRDFVVLPKDPWKVETPLPEIDGVNIRDNSYAQMSINSIAQIRNRGNYNEIWVSISQMGKPAYLAVYRTDIKEWMVIPENITELLVDRNGKIWGSHSGYATTQSSDDRLLSEFDEQEGVFKVVEDLNSLPSGIEKDGFYYYSKVLLDNNGIFWILVPNDAIYNFDPATNRLTHLVDLAFFFQDAKFDTNGGLYVFTSVFSLQSGHEYHTYLISHFQAETGSFRTYDLNQIIEPSPTATNIFVDHLGRLWLDNIAFKDVNDMWYQIQRSSVFVSNSKETPYDQRYKSAKILTESSDGKLWFLHRDNGMIYLEPDKSEWCWFTTEKSNVVEDQQNNLWMIADGTLYKRLLSP